MSKPVVAFYHSDGLVPAWDLARRYAGEDGHIATLPEIIQSRVMSSSETDPAWTNWFTTDSFECVGYSAAGNLIIIVGHGNKPMASLHGITDAYSYQYNDKTRNHRGGRLSKYQFQKLECGKYGNVSIIDLKSYLSRFQYPFLEPMGTDEAMTDPLVKARLGLFYDNYILRMDRMAKEYISKRFNRRVRYPIILQMGDASNCCYQHFDHLSPDGLPLFHLLAISRLTPMNYCEYPGTQLVTEVDAHEWSNSVKFMGVPKDGSHGNVVIAQDAYGILRKHWHELMEPVTFASSPRLSNLTNLGDTYFSTYEKKGTSLDSYEPQFRVTEMEPVGEEVLLIVPIAGYYGFFKYDIKEVLALKPLTANAYRLVDDPILVNREGGDATHQSVHIRFYKCTFDTTRQVKRVNSIWRNPDLMMKYALAE